MHRSHTGVPQIAQVAIAGRSGCVPQTVASLTSSSFRPRARGFAARNARAGALPQPSTPAPAPAVTPAWDAGGREPPRTGGRRDARRSAHDLVPPTGGRAAHLDLGLELRRLLGLRRRHRDLTGSDRPAALVDEDQPDLH